MNGQSGLVVSYATFLEVRARRQRAVAELARLQTDTLDGDPPESPVTLQVEAIESPEGVVATDPHRLLPVNI